MANKHLKRKPQHASDVERWWWYEDTHGVDIVVTQAALEHGANGTAILTIPWRSIRAALRRKDKPDGE